MEELLAELAPRVQIQTGDVALRESLCSTLRAAGMTVVEGDVEPLDIVVSCAGEVSDAGRTEVGDSTWRPGRIVIGDADAGEADVLLPLHFQPRELVTACRLLAEVVRLRRRLDEGIRQGQALQQEAWCDPLTGLPNRRAWANELKARIETARNLRAPLCIALVDLDHFKQINDGWGHPAGDQLLVALAGALRQSLRQDDFVARLGGDEFGLLLSGLDTADAANVIERVRVGLPARIAQATPFVTSTSIGYCLYDGSSEATAEQLMAQADEARRRAKTQGRDRSTSVS